MRVVHSPDSVRHNLATFFRRGKLIAHPEAVERYFTLHDAALEAGHTLVEAADHGIAPIAAVHDRAYLTLLKTAWSRREEMAPSADMLLPTQFARSPDQRRTAGLINQLGYHMSDTSTPIVAGTWAAVYGAAQAAINAADAAREDGVAYALCRPPGHHAAAGCAGGFCYLNNTAIAAERLRERVVGKVAVLDVDVHHGNGTQAIFYGRDDVFTVSVHAETTNYYPLFTGFADERGVGVGEGFNLNIPLTHGSDDEDVLSAVESAIHSISAFRPVALVVALGFDAAFDDPMGVFAVTTEGFARIAQAVAQVDLPTVLIQEGGYPCATLGPNLATFLGAFGHRE